VNATPKPHPVGSIAAHLAAQRSGASAVEAVEAALGALEDLCAIDPAVLVGAPLRRSALWAAARLDARVAGGELPAGGLPLHGVPFVVKDNLDLLNEITTCACPSSGYRAGTDAEVVARLRALGAIPVGKTNMDQFATGLVGTRSPLGTPRNPHDARLVPGGSSSGSAVAVARGVVPFSLGTDTAGSGRVPAALCGIVGLKPTIGRIPTAGVVAAIARFDCVSLFARSVGDAALVARLVRDEAVPTSAAAAPLAVRRVGIASRRALEPVLETGALIAYDEAVEAARQAGLAIVTVDIDPFLEAGLLLYGSALVAERSADVLPRWPEGAPDLDPTVARIIRGGTSHGAVDAFRAEQRRRAAARSAAGMFAPGGIDALLLPTTPGVATLEQVAADPTGANARLGTFTTFVNLLDLAAVCLPLGVRPDGLPAGVQLVGPAWSDDALADTAAMLAGEPDDPPALRPGEVGLVVVGAHLRGMPLNHQLVDRRARFVAATHTAPAYRLHALAGTVPPKPGLERVAAGGAPVAVELWALSPADFASFVAAIPPPLGIGTVELVDGSSHRGFICEPCGLDGAEDITAHGGWRAYLAAAGSRR
jgi:allophanate hydrolase